jgi:transposase
VLESRAALRARDLDIQHLKLPLAKRRRMQFGRSCEALTERIEQLSLSIEALEACEAEVPAPATAPEATAKTKPVRKPLPAHLPREPVVRAPVAPGCDCPACGGTLRALGEDVSEILKYVHGHFKVIRQIRPRSRSFKK